MVDSSMKQEKGLKVLFRGIKKKLRNTMEKEVWLIRRKEKIRIRQTFLKYPYKFPKSWFKEAKGVKLKCIKQKQEFHLFISVWIGGWLEENNVILKKIK